MYDDGWFGLSYSFLDCHADTEEIKIIKIHQFYEKKHLKGVQVLPHLWIPAAIY